MASDSAPDGNSRREWSVLLLEDSAMTMVARSLLLAARLGLIAVAVTACATGTNYLNPSGSTTTLMAGWQYRFKLEWSVDPEPGGDASHSWLRHQPIRRARRCFARSRASIRLVWCCRRSADRV